MDITEYSRDVIDRSRAGDRIDGQDRERPPPDDGRTQERPAPDDPADVPPWYLNLLAYPCGEFDDQAYDAVATTLDDEERRLVWDQLVPHAPWLVDDQARTSGTLPIVVLSRRPLAP